MLKPKGGVYSKENRSPSAEDPSSSGKDLVSVAEILPPHLVLLPVAHTSLFPGMVVPLILPEGDLTKAIDHAMEGTGVVGVILTRDSRDKALATGPTTSLTGLPYPDGGANLGEYASPSKEFFRYGVAAKILKRINLPDNQVSVLVTGLQRFEVASIVSQAPFVVAAVHYIYEESERGTEQEALLRSALAQFKQLSKDNPLISEEVKVALVNIDGPGKLADFMGSILVRDVRDYQELLGIAVISKRLQKLLTLLRREQDVQNVQRKIQDDINSKVTSAQREFYLHEQLKSIQKELGKATDDRSRLVKKFKDRLQTKKLGKEAKVRIDEEMEKLGTLPEQSSEYSVSVNYLDWVTSLPWGERAEEQFGLKRAKGILDDDHFGLKEVKQRILEFLAVRELKRSSEGTILCLVGPPGTGKTSLGRSVARALGRKFFRFSVGGMRDEAEIKGHRRTYVGAMPGKVIQGLKRSGAQNPVFLIDEIDKLGTGWASGGDPSSALLEVLDPEQNGEFLDHYVDIPFDCSEIFFITTANTTDTIPAALLDRMEIIQLHGYTDLEKLHIAKDHLLPKQLKKSGLARDAVSFADGGLRALIAQYAREAGVRNLEKQISRVLRKIAYRQVMGKKGRVVLDGMTALEKFLGKPPHPPEEIWRKTPGVAMGLAWTSFGGETLYVESSSVEGRGGLVLTGTLGKVMQESGNIAYSLVRSRARNLGLSRHYFDRHVLHVHVPAGATPKDGPSAGITIAMSVLSLLLDRALPGGMAMTGELTLSGRVLPVGGIQEKLLAARRTGVKTILLPKANAKDLKEIAPELKRGLTLILIEDIDDAVRRLLPGMPRPKKPAI